MLHVHHQKPGRPCSDKIRLLLHAMQEKQYVLPWPGSVPGVVYLSWCSITVSCRALPFAAPARQLSSSTPRPLSQSISTRPGCGQALQIPRRQKRGQTGQELCRTPQLSEPEALLCNGSCSQDASTGVSPRPQKKPNRVFFLEHPRHCW